MIRISRGNGMNPNKWYDALEYRVAFLKKKENTEVTIEKYMMENCIKKDYLDIIPRTWEIYMLNKARRIIY